ncbi:cytochrome c-type biogenesis protein [Vibrio sp. TH_r3]|uniref:cytochrome c-type biogenesis protein n=1 Tax=Vibrio sp. TH_r3 TaxID=3082084 RepID=UPI002954BAD6|nr:cytochrome c-type biogenesis protein [Vibrio sp. TH_r3]MDV7103188.1 cytochrome c-type biogenesis protein [Vibrio sp. TH_r3]
MKKILAVLFSVLLISLPVTAAIDVFEFDNDQQEQQFKELSHTLRCPKCQNNTISDSNAELAKDLRLKVYEMTKAGKSKDEIVDYMVARYGNFVTYKPPFTIATSILWLGPLLVVLIGFGIIVGNSKRKSQQSVSLVGTDSIADANQLDAEEQVRLDALLKEKNGDKQ